MPKSVELDYQSANKLKDSEYKIFFDIINFSDPTVFLELEQILDERGLTLEYDILTGRASLHVDLEHGASISSTLEKVKDIVSDNFVDPSRKIDVDINSAPTATAGNVLVPGSRANLNILEKGTKLFLRGKDRLKGSRDHEQYQNKKEVKHVIEQTKAAGTQLDAIVEQSLSDNDMDDMINYLGFVLPPTEEIICDFANVIKVSIDEFPDNSSEKLALEVIYKKTVYRLLKEHRIRDLLNAIGGGAPDFRRLSYDDLTVLADGLVIDGVRFDKENRAFFAEILRDILNFDSASLTPNEANLVRILVFPMDISPLEIGLMPVDKLMSLVNNINRASSHIADLAEFLGLPTTDPIAIELYSNLKVISLLDISRDKLIDVIFNKDLSTKSINSILKNILEMIKNTVPIMLAKNYAKQKNSLVFGEALSYLEYLYKNTSDVNLLQERNSFLAELYRVFVAGGIDDTNLHDEMLIHILKIIDSGAIIGFDKKKVDEFKLKKIALKLTQSWGGGVKPILPVVAKGTPAKSLGLKVTLTGDNRNTQSVHIEHDGSMPELVELFLEKPDILNAQTNLFVIRENISKLKNELEREGLFQYLVALLHNSMDPAHIEKEVLKYIYNANGGTQLYLRQIQNYLQKFISRDITSNVAEKEQIAKFLASRLVLDVLIGRTRKDNMASRIARPDIEFADVAVLNLSREAQGIIGTLQGADGRLDLASLDNNSRNELTRESRKAELKLEVIKILRDNNGVITAEERIDLVNRVVELLVIRETDVKRKLSNSFKKEMERFILDLLAPANINPVTGIHRDADKMQTSLEDERDNLFVILGRSFESVSLEEDKIYTDLRSVSSDLTKFMQDYEQNILNEVIELDDLQIERNFKGFVQEYEDYMKTRIKALRPELTTIGGNYLGALNERITKIRNADLKRFITNKFLASGAVSQEEYLNVVAFIDLLGEDLNLSELEFKVLFALINNLAGQQVPFDIAKIKVDGVIYRKTANRALGHKLLKYLMKKSLLEAKRYDYEFDLTNRLAKRLPDKAVTPEPSGVSGNVTVAGKDIKVEDPNKRSLIVQFAKKVINKRTIPTAMAVAGGTALGAGAVMGGVAPFVYAGSVAMGALGMKRDRMRTVELQDSEENRELLLEDMRRMPEIVRQHTNNLLLVNATNEVIDQAQKDLTEINTKIYPAILASLKRKERREKNKFVSMEAVPYLNREINKLMNELDHLIKLDIVTNQIDSSTFQIKISKLLSKVNELMQRTIASLENDILGNNMKIGRNQRDYLRLQTLKEKYTNARFARVA